MANPRVPKLSRATFCLIAETIRTIDFDSLADRDRVIANFTDALRTTNPNFKPERFKDACRPTRTLCADRRAA